MSVRPFDFFQNLWGTVFSSLKFSSLHRFVPKEAKVKVITIQLWSNRLFFMCHDFLSSTDDAFIITIGHSTVNTKD
jgi:hypothetical protein